MSIENVFEQLQNMQMLCHVLSITLENSEVIQFSNEEMGGCFAHLAWCMEECLNESIE